MIIYGIWVLDLLFQKGSAENNLINDKKQIHFILIFSYKAQGLRGCGFFHIKNDKIVFQRGYWDKLSMHKFHNIPLKNL